VPDVTAGLDTSGSPRTVTIETGQLATRLCWRSQVRPDEVALSFARIGARRTQQTVTLDRSFIPPILDARIHDALRSLIDELRTVMQARLSSYAPLRTLPAAGGLADLAALLLRQAMTEYRIRLAHLDAFDPLPPAMLHHELIGLLGRLSVLPGVDETIGTQSFTYRHDDLQQSFEPLMHALRYALARIIETPVVPLSFEHRGDAIHVCPVDPQWQLDMLVFAFSAALPAEQLRQTLPQQAKLGPIEQIQKLVDLQLPGARLVPLPTPPRQIPYYAQRVYFAVESADPFLQATLSGAAIALRIVGEFPDLSFDAWGLRKDKAA
jgi:type VI secretion system protein ImpJ